MLEEELASAREAASGAEAKAAALAELKDKLAASLKAKMQEQIESIEKQEQLGKEKAALEELHARRPDRVLATNVEFWAAIMLDFAEVPAHMFTSMFTCARMGGWSAHVLEQKSLQRLVRPAARYVGPGPRKPTDVEGWHDIPHGV